MGWRPHRRVELAVRELRKICECRFQVGDSFVDPVDTLVDFGERGFRALGAKRFAVDALHRAVERDFDLPGLGPEILMALPLNEIESPKEATWPRRGLLVRTLSIGGGENGA